jgi:hypothetical protein
MASYRAAREQQLQSTLLMEGMATAVAYVGLVHAVRTRDDRESLCRRPVMPTGGVWPPSGRDAVDPACGRCGELAT